MGLPYLNQNNEIFFLLQEENSVDWVLQLYVDKTGQNWEGLAPAGDMLTVKDINCL